MALKLPEWLPGIGGWGVGPLRPEESPASPPGLLRRGVLRRQEQIQVPIEAAAGHYTVAACWNLLYRSSMLVKPVVERRNGDEWERVEEHPFYDWWEEAGPRGGATELLGLIWWEYLTYGEAFIRIIRDGITRPVGWDVMPLSYSAYYARRQSPQQGYVRVFVDRQTDEFRYEYTDYRSQRIDVTPDTIHLRWGLALENPRRGYPPILPVLPFIFLAQAATQFWSVRLDHPTQVDFIVHRPPVDGTQPVRQQQQQMESLAAAIEDSHDRFDAGTRYGN